MERNSLSSGFVGGSPRALWGERGVLVSFFVLCQSISTLVRVCLEKGEMKVMDHVECEKGRRESENE